LKSFPKIDDANDRELIYIVYVAPDEWQIEAVQYAKELLLKRGFSEELQKEKAIELKKEIEIEDTREFAQRLEESYSIISLLFMAIFWYRTIFYDWYLNKNGYHKKRKQRLLAILAGVLFYGGMILIEIPFIEKEHQEKLNEITQIGVERENALAEIDWSGIYLFTDSSSTQTPKAIWNLIISKKKNKHTSILVIGSDTTNLAVILKLDRLIFLPRKDYTIIHKREYTTNDELFILTKVKGIIYTQWENLKPSSLKDSNAYGLFFNKAETATKASR